MRIKTLAAFGAALVLVACGSSSQEDAVATDSYTSAEAGSEMGGDADVTDFSSQGKYTSAEPVSYDAAREAEIAMLEDMTHEEVKAYFAANGRKN